MLSCCYIEKQKELADTVFTIKLRSYESVSNHLKSNVNIYLQYYSKSVFSQELRNPSESFHSSIERGLKMPEVILIFGTLQIMPS